MAKDAKQVPVYAQVQAPSGNVVSAAHPTQARNPNYRPPFPVPEKGDILTKNRKYALLKVGHASFEQDGEVRITLSARPPSNVLVIPKHSRR